MQGTTSQMGGQAQAQAQTMTVPPEVLTSKDLSYAKDAMTWLMLASKKCSHFASEVQDSDVLAALQKIGQMNAQHYNTLLQYCQQHANQQSQASQKQ